MPAELDKHPSQFEEVEQLSISVVASATTRDFEVQLQSQCGDLIARFGDGMMGLDPGDILVHPCPLLPGNGPQTVCIGRCDCGIVECGSVEITISKEGQWVRWTNATRVNGVRFDAAQYDSEVQRALQDLSWESPERTLARLIAQQVDRARLGEFGLRFDWVGSREEKSRIAIALEHREGPSQVIVCVPWNGKATQEVAEQICGVLRLEPRKWADVVWYPPSKSSASLQISGPGWRCGLA
jgi:hypothetical protein